MKNIFFLFILMQISSILFAQAPEKMSYQAIVRDASNNLLNNTSVGMRISILQGSTTGNAVYIETQTPSTNTSGLVSIEIGTGNVVSGSFSNIDWANGPYFIRTETDPNGGSSYTLNSTNQLLSVPYALYAKNAGTANGGGNFTHYIGEEFGGGVIFYLWKDAQGVEHGLIVDKTDLSNSQSWSNVTTSLIGSNAQNPSDGLSNSNAIVGQASHTNSAAALCLNSNNGGQSDWYLPSIEELQILWSNKFVVNKSLRSISSATEILLISYWSSTEYASTNAWRLYFNSGASYLTLFDDKYVVGNVRAIRAF